MNIDRAIAASLRLLTTLSRLARFSIQDASDVATPL